MPEDARSQIAALLQQGRQAPEQWSMPEAAFVIGSAHNQIVALLAPQNEREHARADWMIAEWMCGRILLSADEWAAHMLA